MENSDLSLDVVWVLGLSQSINMKTPDAFAVDNKLKCHSNWESFI